MTHAAQTPLNIRPSSPTGFGKLTLAGAALVLILLGFGFGRWSTTSAPSLPEPPGAEAPAPQVWTCSMHPQIKLPQAGDCRGQRGSPARALKSGRVPGRHRDEPRPSAQGPP